MRGRFGDLITAMVTPFDEGGAVDLEGARRLAGWLVDNGSEGLVVTGSTGEAPTLTDDERVSLWRTVADAVGDRASVIAGSGTNDTAHSIDLTQAAQEAGVHASLLVTPYYNKPPQRGLLEHFQAIADATMLPLFVYDIPGRTALKIEHRTLIEIAAIDNVVAVKDSAGDVQGASRLVSQAPPDFQVYCGNDGETLPWLAVGAVGVVSVASHVVGPQMAEMIGRFKGGDADGARKIHLDLMPVFDAMAITTNPIPVKAAVGLLGLPAGSPRLPLPAATPEEIERIREVLARAGAI
ncbi:MAG: 4-hydroxy-tetrahydrodipicolinate synthase [Actinomycetota bacterium]